MGKHFKSHPYVIPLTECPFSLLFYSALPPPHRAEKIHSTTHLNVKTFHFECFTAENYLKHFNEICDKTTKRIIVQIPPVESHRKR